MHFVQEFKTFSIFIYFLKDMSCLKTPKFCSSKMRLCKHWQKSVFCCCATLIIDPLKIKPLRLQTYSQLFYYHYFYLLSKFVIKIHYEWYFLGTKILWNIGSASSFVNFFPLFHLIQKSAGKEIKFFIRILVSKEIAAINFRNRGNVTFTKYI